MLLYFTSQTNPFLFIVIHVIVCVYNAMYTFHYLNSAVADNKDELIQVALLINITML